MGSVLENLFPPTLPFPPVFFISHIFLGAGEEKRFL
jgi:hypothetical protein